MPSTKTAHNQSKKKSNEKKKNNKNDLDKTNVTQHIPVGRNTPNSNENFHYNHDDVYIHCV
jgi:hypothetical protein